MHVETEATGACLVDNVVEEGGGKVLGSVSCVLWIFIGSGMWLCLGESVSIVFYAYLFGRARGLLSRREHPSDMPFGLEEKMSGPQRDGVKCNLVVQQQ